MAAGDLPLEVHSVIYQGCFRFCLRLGRALHGDIDTVASPHVFSAFSFLLMNPFPYYCSRSFTHDAVNGSVMSSVGADKIVL